MKDYLSQSLMLYDYKASLVAEKYIVESMIVAVTKMKSLLVLPQL